ncbi:MULTISPECIES: hypothetical protein [Nostoc]|uniref:Restriction endonuclease subunit R n=1 Tax=Nostoc paludosum FACHB-159 TaxID=2692908 RepID=A0ABR8KKI9_9NOSO|nr:MULTISPECIES: hypothetical protein [Nostoc]MBD2682954.1 hypothetical protein [Nostoc sp. FACHB-857]MBD2739293.1 hypothetical protein [Nostoc paludosum FACHB-159]
MSYSDFTLKKVKAEFNLTIVERPTFVEEVEPITPSELLSTFLEKHLPLALAVNTEKARSEWLISPILLEIKDTLSNHISLFSGTDFTVDSSLGLNGVCDFLISKSTEQLFIEAPAVVIVEAKREDLNAGLGQCIASMIAAQKFNEQNHTQVPTIYGSVTTGDRWKFLKLEETIVTIGLLEYNIPPVNHLLGMLTSFVS